MSALTAESPAPERGCRCGRCGMAYDARRFADLAPIQTLAGSELAEHVVHWPEGVVVDVRACARCQAPIARLSREPA